MQQGNGNGSSAGFSWRDRKTLVTGGTSFIGSHLVDALVARGAQVRVIDDLTSGKLENIPDHVESSRVEFIRGDLREPGVARSALAGMEIIFHLAADHGGRGYVDLHQGGPASNLFLDGAVFREALNTGVDKVVFASSGCVYPNYLQNDASKEIYLNEYLVKPPHDADNMYGWAKLMGELTLRAYYRDFGLKSASCRYFTVYGPRGVENHAVIAMIAKAFIRKDPFEVWGDGTQIRNWTYIDDIVAGTILAAERITDGTPVNLETMERIRVIDAVEMVLDYTGHRPRIVFRPEMPTGPLNRVADNSLARKLLGWQPQVKFRDGLKRTIDWYFSSRDLEQLGKELELELALMER
jgi:nucleoside-diphosphate-sugar epimerase